MDFVISRIKKSQKAQKARGLTSLSSGISTRFGRSFRSLGLGLGIVAAGMLAGCNASNGLGLNSGSNTNQTQNQSAPVLTPNPQGEVVGQGATRVAMLLPLSAPGNAASVARELKNGAIMAMNDHGNRNIQLVFKDTKGQSSTSQDLASEAVKEGASAILGPLYSSNVSSAAGVALPAGRTILAFSSDASVARRGVYLLSYIPQEDVKRAITYGISQGRRSILAFLPTNAEGAIREAELKKIGVSSGALVQVIKYERSGPGIQQAAKNGVPLAATADLIYIPEGGGIPSAILTTLSKSGVSLSGKQVVGSGAWETVKTSDPILAGAIYPGRDISRFNQFAARYKSSYGAQPSVQAAIGYDAVTLASELVRQVGGKNAFTPKVLENPSGFIGVNGIFRLKDNGIDERGLAIYQINGGVGQLVSPAPTTFAQPRT